MITEEIKIANLKCGGCASTIKKELLKLAEVTSVDVNIENDLVHLSYIESGRSKIIEKLHRMGYPEATDKNGLLLQLKSYSSCMIGKINNL